MPVEELVFTLKISSLFMTNPPLRHAKEQPGGPNPMTCKKPTARHLPSAGSTRWSLIPGEIFLFGIPVYLDGCPAGTCSHFHNVFFLRGCLKLLTDDATVFMYSNCHSFYDSV